MSVHVAAWALDQDAGSPAGKLVLLLLADNANDDGWLPWPQPQVQRDCQMQPPTFRSHVKKLEQKGLLEQQEGWCHLLVPWDGEP